MNKVKIDIYQGIVIPLEIESDKISEILSESLNDMHQMELNFPLDSEPNVTVKITVHDVLEGEKKVLWETFKTYHKRQEIFIKSSATIYFKDQDFRDFVSGTTNSNDFYVHEILIPDFEKRYYDFVIALDIARVGAFHHGQALLFSNNKFIKRLTDLGLHPEEALEYAIKTKWPIFESLDIAKTWDWYLAKAFPVRLDEISGDSLSRAIKAFSHLYNANASHIERVFWAMMGIESLYVSGRENITDQVRKKVPLFLGEIKEHKNRLSKMYEYRSGIFHGGQNIPGYFHIHDGLDSYEKFMEDYGEASDITKTVLIATLQRMAKLDLRGLQFEYVLATPS